jgi:hypothetical protein
MPCATMLHDLFEYVSLQMTFEAIMNPKMKSRWPDEPGGTSLEALQKN